MKAMALAVGALALGFLLGRFFTPSTPTRLNESTPRTWAQQGMSEIQSGGGDAAQQLKAAEEYYGKSVVLFLASLVNRSSGAATADRTLAEPIVKELPADSAPAGPDVTPAESGSPRAQAAKGPGKKAEPTKEQTDLDRMITHRKSSYADSLKNPTIRRMMGQFSGTFTLMVGENKGRVDTVQLEMDYQQDGKELKGDFLMIMAKPDGEVYSRRTGDGKNATLRLVPNRPDFVYLEPAPGDFVLLDTRNPRHMIGDYYDDSGAYRGKLELWRN